MIMSIISSSCIQLIICFPEPTGTPRNNLNIGYKLLRTPPSFERTNPILKTVVFTFMLLNFNTSSSHFLTTPERKPLPGGSDSSWAECVSAL